MVALKDPPLRVNTQALRNILVDASPPECGNRLRAFFNDTESKITIDNSLDIHSLINSYKGDLPKMWSVFQAPETPLDVRNELKKLLTTYREFNYPSVAPEIFMQAETEKALKIFSDILEMLDDPDFAPETYRAIKWEIENRSSKNSKDYHAKIDLLLTLRARHQNKDPVWDPED